MAIAPRRNGTPAGVAGLPARHGYQNETRYSLPLSVPEYHCWSGGLLRKISLLWCEAVEKTSQAENPDASRLPPESIFRSERKWLIFAAAYCGLFLLVSVFARGHTRFLAWFGNLAQIVPVVLALEMSGLAAIRHRHAGRVFWTLWAVACYCYLLTCLFWAGSELLLQQPDVGYFPETDIPAFLHAIFLLGALFWRPEKNQSRANSPQRLFDFLLVFGAALYLYFYAVGVHYIARGNEAAYLRHYDLLQAGKNVLVVVFLVFRAFQTWRTPWKPIFALLAMGGVTYAIGNVIVNAAITGDVYATGSLYDLGLMAPFFCYAIAARHSRRSIQQLRLPLPRPFSMESGVVSTVVAFLLVAAIPTFDWLWRYSSPGPAAAEKFRMDLTHAIFVVVVVLIGGRQIVVQRVGAKLFRQIERVYRKLRSSQARLRDVVEYSDDWIYSRDMQGHFTMTNPAITSLLGFQPDEIIGRSVEEFLWPESCHEFSSFRKALLSARRLRGLISFRNKQGDQVVLECQESVIQVGGVAVGVRGVARDVTEVTRLRKQLEDSEKHYRELVENASDIIFSCSADGTLVSMNRAGCRFLGRPAGEIVGRQWSQLIRPGAAAGLTLAFKQLGNIKISNLIVELNNAAGQPRIFELVLSIEEEGTVPGLIRGVGRDVTESLQQKKELETQALTDTLTGCYNRRFFAERLEQELASCQRSGTPCCLLMVDMDDLKRINDTRGHPVGDEAIRAVAAVLTRTTRRSDTIARLGGDEFAILLGGCPPSTAVILAERILKAIARQRISSNDSLSVSIGIATYPDDGQTTQELQGAADQALYAAKGKGGNCFVVNQQSLRLA